MSAKGDVRAAALEGGEGLDGDRERPEDAEVFGVAGVLSRPSGAPEAVVVQVGGRGHDVVVATRDHAWAVAVGAAKMPAGETWIFNSKAFIRIRANGDVEVGRPDGAFEKVSTESHVHGTGSYASVGGGGGGALVAGGKSGGAVNSTGGKGIAKNLKAET